MTRLLLLLLASSLLLVVAIWRRRQFTPAPADTAVDTAIPGQIPVARTVHDVLRRLEGRAGRQFVRLEAAVAETLMIAGDRDALADLLSVLSAHAIESTPCGRVLVTARHRDDGTAIAIVDDGIGIATARTERMLEHSREALALLGGTLDVRRSQGIGTTMTIVVPTRAAAPAAPWNATIQSTMADFARVTETKSARAEHEETSS